MLPQQVSNQSFLPDQVFLLLLVKLAHIVMSSFLSLTHDSTGGSQSNETSQQISLCLLLKNSAQLGPSFSSSADYIKTIVNKYKVKMLLTHYSSPTFSRTHTGGRVPSVPTMTVERIIFLVPPSPCNLVINAAPRWYHGRKLSIAKIVPCFSKLWLSPAKISD